MERLPAIKIAGPFRTAEARGAVTVWYRHPDRSEIRWRYRNGEARFPLLTICEVIASIDLGPPELDDGLTDAQHEAEAWGRAARRIRAEPNALAGNWTLRGVEQWSFDDGAPEVALVERHVWRRLGRRVEWKAQAMPLATLALVADHYNAVAIAFRRAWSDAPRRLHERRRIVPLDET